MGTAGKLLAPFEASRGKGADAESVYAATVEQQEAVVKIHMKPAPAQERVTAKDPGTGPITVHVQTDAGEVWLSVDRQASDELDGLKARDEWPAEWTVPTERGPAPIVTLVLTENDANGLTFPKPKAA